MATLPVPPSMGTYNASVFVPEQEYYGKKIQNRGSNFNFKKFLSRTYDEDFEKVVGIRTRFNLHFSPGVGSCFSREKQDIAIRIAMSLAVQLLCGYVTLPLYALVTQMGSSMKKEIFSERVVLGLKNWRKKAKGSVSKNNSTCSRHSASLHSQKSDNSVRDAIESMHNNKVDNEDIQSVVEMNPPYANHSRNEEEEEIIVDTIEQEILITSENTHSNEEDNAKIITRGIYDGEVSFGIYVCSSSRGIGEIVSIAEEEDDTDHDHTLPHLNP
ncbi:MLO-like protein 6-like [Trifolium pratense]|uniref:MLO-like protein 6-like n=1 Tax=Trifolium pratense TaxID=57577 RepID=A0A2K3PKS0_TRIPR|nr:MLO-like protein 6-like [Trifolium pratense]